VSEKTTTSWATYVKWKFVFEQLYKNGKFSLKLVMIRLKFWMLGYQITGSLLYTGIVYWLLALSL
jgi:hypothetical protein